MKYHLLILLSLLLFSTGSFADTCYDPYYGYYECGNSYYNYPDTSQAFVEGAFFGLVLGGFNNNEYYEGNHNRHENRGGYGGGVNHSGGVNHAAMINRGGNHHH